MAAINETVDNELQRRVPRPVGFAAARLSSLRRIDSVTRASAEFAFDIDHSLPTGSMTVEWRKAGGAFQLLSVPRPSVQRGSSPVDLEFRVTMAASATHLRSAILTLADRGGGDFTLLSGTTEHWHISTSDDAEVLQGIYRLPKQALPGTYGFCGEVFGRACNPGGEDRGQLKSVLLEYDLNDRHIYASFTFSVVDAD